MKCSSVQAIREKVIVKDLLLRIKQIYFGSLFSNNIEHDYYLQNHKQKCLLMFLKMPGFCLVLGVNERDIRLNIEGLVHSETSVALDNLVEKWMSVKN